MSAVPLCSTPERAMPEISLVKVADFKVVENLWRRLEPRTESSFFQSWAWMGCLVEERFSDPVLLTVRVDDCTVGLGLFNHRRRRFVGSSTLWLGESGDPEHDAIFIEHNGLLLDRSQPKDLLNACILAAQRSAIGTAQPGRSRSIILSGVGDEYVAAAKASLGSVHILA